MMARSVAGICVREGAVFVARRGSSGSCEGLWEFPGGKVETGESDETAIIREFDEEFGIEARPLRLLGETRFSHGGIERTLAAWLIELPSVEGFELREHSESAWIAIDRLDGLQMVESDRKLADIIRGRMSS